MDLKITSIGILFLKIETSSSPLKTEKVLITKTPKVVVLIPPPVDAGEAPINISRIVKTTDEPFINPILRELKPAVLEVTDIKNEDKIFSFCVNPCMDGSLYSNR